MSVLGAHFLRSASWPVMSLGFGGLTAGNSGSVSALGGTARPTVLNSESTSRRVEGAGPCAHRMQLGVPGTA